MSSYAMRADRIATEFQLNAIILGSGKEYKRLDGDQGHRAAGDRAGEFSQGPERGHARGGINVSLDRLMHWDLAVENPGRLADAGV